MSINNIYLLWARVYAAFMTTASALALKFAQIWPHLDERARRMMAANEARGLGYGGVSKVSDACGLSRVTITKAMRELDEAPLPPGRIRRPGAGRRSVLDLDPDLAALVNHLPVENVGFASEWMMV